MYFGYMYYLNLCGQTFFLLPQWQKEKGLATQDYVLLGYVVGASNYESNIKNNKMNGHFLEGLRGFSSKFKMVCALLDNLYNKSDWVLNKFMG